MSPTIVPVFFALMLLGWLGLAARAWRRDQQRQDALRLWALGRDWRIWPGGEWGPHVEHPAVALFQRGHSRRCGCLIRGAVDELPVALFDYEYQVGSGRNQTPHRHGVVVMTLPYPVQPLLIRPENLADRLGGHLGGGDIDFESAEFSRRFFVTSPDRKWAFDIIHARMMEYLLAAPRPAIEFGGHEIVVYREGYAQPADYESALELIAGVRRLIPEFVVRRQRGEQT